MKRQTGFTLIELMIVVAIIGILATMAVPMYQDYTIRTQVTEGLTLAAEVKAAIGTFNAMRGNLPDSNAAAGVADADSITGNYVTSVAIGDNGAITITYGGDRAHEKIKDKTLGLNPVRNEAGGLIWVCGTADPPTDTTEVGAEAPTDLDVSHLPPDCR